MYLVCKPLVIKLRLQILTLAFSLFKMPKNCQINKKIGRQNINMMAKADWKLINPNLQTDSIHKPAQKFELIRKLL